MPSLPTLYIAIVMPQTMDRAAFAALLGNLDADFNIHMKAPNIQHLLAEIDSSDLQPDVCIVDVKINYGEKDMAEDISVLHKAYPHIPILLITDTMEKYLLLKFMAAGPAGIITRKEEPGVLRDALVALYQRREYVSKQIREVFPKINEDPQRQLKELFTSKELQYLSLCSTNMTKPKIAQAMNIDIRSTEYYYNNLRTKLNLDSRTDLVLFAKRNGFTSASNGMVE